MSYELDLIEIKRLMETILDEVRQIKKRIKTLDPLDTPSGLHPTDEELLKRVATFECPECGSPMTLRRRNSDKQPFMGCSDYPDCTGLRDINGTPKENLQARFDNWEDEW